MRDLPPTPRQSCPAGSPGARNELPPIPISLAHDQRPRGASARRQPSASTKFWVGGSAQASRIRRANPSRCARKRMSSAPAPQPGWLALTAGAASIGVDAPSSERGLANNPDRRRVSAAGARPACRRFATTVPWLQRSQSYIARHQSASATSASPRPSMGPVRPPCVGSSTASLALSEL